MISPVDIRHNVQSDRRKLRLGANPRAIPGALVIFEAHFTPQSPFSRAIFAAMLFSGAVPPTIASLRCYNGHNGQAKTASSTDLLQNVKKACSPTPLSCPPSSVETPVCRRIRRTPLPCRARSSGGRQRGFEGCVKNDLSGCRRNRLGSWDEKTSCVAFSASIQSDF